MERVLFILVTCIIISTNGFLNPYPKGKRSVVEDGGDPGTPLFLTPYIESGEIEKARNLSQVDFPGFPQIKSYAGFFTVDKNYNSNQFLWYFPAERMTNDSVVYLWLQGGPGSSSLFGLFTENGPFEVKNQTFQLRDVQGRWSYTDHVIYIDNPVGSGFSFTNDSRGYCTDEIQIGEHLYNTLTQFFQLFPELQKLDFVISGESYAGKYIPALGITIHKKNPVAEVKINLKGMMIGDGWCDPINQLDYGEYLYQIGLLSWNQKKRAEDLKNETIELIIKEAWKDAKKAALDLFSYLGECMPHVSWYNYMELISIKHDDYVKLIQESAIRKAIHVGNIQYDDHNYIAINMLEEDYMQSVAPWISELLEHYPMLFYSGQVDIIVAYPLTLNFLRKLKFSGSEKYLKAGRSLIFYKSPAGTTLESFLTLGGKLSEALVRNAGHMVPADQPGFMRALKYFWIKFGMRAEKLPSKFIFNSDNINAPITNT